MAEVEKILMSLIQEEGIQGAVLALSTAVQAHANEMSDMGLKDKAFRAANVAEFLEDLSIAIEE